MGWGARNEEHEVRMMASVVGEQDAKEEASGRLLLIFFVLDLKFIIKNNLIKK
jgi:hypothetical protein